MNILVVDDEPLIHISIEKLIRTCSEEHCVRHAYNGHEMLDLLGGEAFALAFVDIKMPGPSGLEAIRQARDIAPFTRYYIMTGFDEFEYAKQAIKLKVDDYLMKPLDLKTIRETLAATESQVRLDLEHKKSVFRNWLESTLNRRDSSLQEFTGHYCGLLAVNIDSDSDSPEHILEPFRDYDDHLVSVFMEGGMVLLCFSEKSDYILEMYRALSSRPCPDSVTCFAASITRDAQELKNALPQLLGHTCLRVPLGLGRFYHLAPLMDSSRALLEFSELCISWADALAQRDYSTFSSRSSLLVRQLFSQEEPARCRGHVLEFMALSLGCPDGLPADAGALQAYLEQTAKSFLNGPSEDSKIQAIIRFIQEHYRENISAAELSQRFGLSASYISNLLKGALGIRYNDYVTQLRMNHAKELLVNTRLSVKEITTACGYFSQSHFTKLFLEREGCTPSEYRKTEGP